MHKVDSCMLYFQEIIAGERLRLNLQFVIVLINRRNNSMIFESTIAENDIKKRILFYLIRKDREKFKKSYIKYKYSYNFANM